MRRKTPQGTLLQQKKELELHCDIKRGDRLMFFSTLGWVSDLLSSPLLSSYPLLLRPSPPLILLGSMCQASQLFVLVVSSVDYRSRVVDKRAGTRTAAARVLLLLGTRS